QSAPRATAPPPASPGGPGPGSSAAAPPGGAPGVLPVSVTGSPPPATPAVLPKVTVTDPAPRPAGTTDPGSRPAGAGLPPVVPVPAPPTGSDRLTPTPSAVPSPPPFALSTPAGPAGGRTVGQVRRWDEETYTVQPNDNFLDLSRKFYGTE